MKPVAKGPAPKRCSSYKDAKPHLIERLGSHCSYCEVFGLPTFLDVEHIYPKQAHPKHANRWENFLIACSSCNSKKNSRLGSGRQRGLVKRFLWPHLDNTARAFKYLSDGRVVPAAKLSSPVKKMATDTMDMVGFMASPAKAKGYAARSIAYTGVSVREEVWREIQSIRKDYLKAPGVAHARRIAARAAKRGYFSIWMEVFQNRPEFRRELISAFNADPCCFDRKTRPVRKGRA